MAELLARAPDKVLRDQFQDKRPRPKPWISKASLQAPEHLSAGAPWDPTPLPAPRRLGYRRLRG